jgi:hypothetical protein
MSGMILSNELSSTRGFSKEKYLNIFCWLTAVRMLQIICLQKFGGSRPTGLGGDREHKPKLKDVVERTNLDKSI